MKSSYLIISIIFLCTLIGCGGGGGGGSSTLPATETTIAGQLEVPAVDSGLLGAVSYATDEALLQKIADSGTCTVNGNSAVFSLVPATHFFSVSEIPIATFYDVKFTYEGVELRLVAPHSSTYISKNINLTTTAEAMLIDNYGIDKTTLSSVGIKDEMKDYLAGKLLTQYTKAGTTGNAFDSFFVTELASFTANVPLNSLTTVLTPAVDLTGTWKGSNCIFYNMNFDNERGYRNTGNVTMTLKQTGNVVTGVMDIAIISREKLADGAAPEPDHHTSINGTISSTKFTFTSGSEKWEFDTLSLSMTGKVTNTDTEYYLGIESDARAFLLTKE